MDIEWGKLCSCFPTLIIRFKSLRYCTISRQLRHLNNNYVSGQSQWMRTFLPRSGHIVSAGHARALIGPGGGA